MTPLTQRQREVLEILIRTTEAGRQATVREIGDELGLSSTNGVFEFFDLLEANRFVERMTTGGTSPRARSVRILRNPDGTPYLSPLERYEALVGALGCNGRGFLETLAVVRARRVA